MNSVKIVEDFWTAVWKSRNQDAIADFVVEDVNGADTPESGEYLAKILLSARTALASQKSSIARR